ncbi:hypothetical protein GCM10023175_04120 [Pseudonocardia xishanensis]|uniref:Uncharacterized protein n=1 Tax=Pseudonocardia xishanensis TaxID=630995 RepID=A0ABP8RED9_9PSEU
MLVHDPPDSLVVDPPFGWGAVVELGGDPRTHVRSAVCTVRIRATNAASDAVRAARAGAAAFQA